MNRLKELREAVGFSIAELAEYANLSQTTIRNIEDGYEFNTSLKTAEILAEVFGCKISDIFDGELSRRGRPPQTGRPLTVTTTSEVKIEHPNGSVDVISVSRTRQGTICENCD